MSQQSLNDFKDTKRTLKRKLTSLEELIEKIIDDEHGKYPITLLTIIPPNSTIFANPDHSPT